MNKQEQKHVKVFVNKDPWGRSCKKVVVPVDHPDSKGLVRVVYEYPNGESYNLGHCAGGTWVDSWWD